MSAQDSRVIGEIKVLLTKGTDGRGIEKIEKTSSSGIYDTYTITYDDGSKTTYTITNGNGIESVEKTGTSGLVDTYTITFDNGMIETFDVTNGETISNIAKTSTSGAVDTYTITLNSGRSYTFTVTNGVGTIASDIGYDNTTSGLSATKVQGAIDEIAKPAFTQASSRANINTGEKLSVIFGKIKKFFADLKTVAFTGAYNDLTGKPNLATVATSGSYNDLSNKPTNYIGHLVWTNSNPTAEFGAQTISGLDLSDCDYIKIQFKTMNNGDYLTECVGASKIWAKHFAMNNVGVNSGALWDIYRTCTITLGSNGSVTVSACTRNQMGFSATSEGTPTSLTYSSSTTNNYLIPYKIIKCKYA